MTAASHDRPSASPPDLSLVVPCYNEARHLRASVRSVVEVLEQTGATWDIVFVDDRSEDDTAALIREICAADRRCRAVFHDRNRGRGAAFKTGFAASAGRVTGFLDIDLEVQARTIPVLVAEIERRGADIATGRRHYLLRQTGGLHRAAASWAYRRLSNFLLALDLEDSETGCKFFRRETAGPIVLASANDGWFWDTEVMARARLAGLRIAELPVQFLRRADKSSTVRLWRDSWRYLRALHDFRGVIGVSRRTKSPIYWTGHGYNLVMRVLYGAEYERATAAVAARIPDGASVVEVCCGTARLHHDFLRSRSVRYLGLDFNGDFVMHARRRGADVRWFDLESDPIPCADYVVICSSLYHFTEHADDIVTRLRRAARRAVIVSEPVRNLSQLPVVGPLAAALTHPGVGDGAGHLRRFDLETFTALVRRHDGHVTHDAGDRNALAELPPLAGAADQRNRLPSPREAGRG
jgi:glycosyltransferase involved in cell wall biosynthesis